MPSDSPTTSGKRQIPWWRDQLNLLVPCSLLALLFTFFGILLPESLFFVSLFTFFCEVALCLLLIMGIKKLLGRRSRYVIGS